MPFQKGHPFYGDLTKQDYFQKGHSKPENAYKWPKGHQLFSKGTLGKHWKLPNDIYKGRCFNSGRTHFKKGQHPSPTTEFKKDNIPWSKGKFGKDSPGWKGGKTPIARLIREGDRYKKWRMVVFLRDNFTCQFCGKRGGYLEVHHKNKEMVKIIKEYKIRTIVDALNCAELWDINNGQTLCKKCHDSTKKGRIKKI